MRCFSKIIIILIFYLIFLNNAFAISKKNSLYTGKQLLDDSYNMGFNLHWALKCGFGNDLNIKEEVGRLSWEDYKSFANEWARMGHYKPDKCHQSNRTEALKDRDIYLQSLNKALDEVLGNQNKNITSDKITAEDKSSSLKKLDKSPNLPDCIGIFWNNCFGSKKFSNGEYIGEWKEDKRHGQGTYLWSSGNKYVGEWKANEQHGQGTENYSDGSKYVGYFKEGNYNGYGIYTFADGEIDLGQWLDGKLNGEAIQYNKDGSIYKQGIYKDDELLNSKDIKTFSQKKDKVKTLKTDKVKTQETDKIKTSVSSLPGCQGKYWDDCFGEENFDNGNNYIGEWKDNKRHGQGSETFSDGSKYVGQFLNDQRNGFGTYLWSKGSKYDGEWKDNEQHGEGTKTYYNGDMYVGEWKFGKYNGQGTYFFDNREMEVGQWKDGQLNGEAIQFNSDGTIARQGVFDSNQFLFAKEVKVVPFDKGKNSELPLNNKQQNIVDYLVPKIELISTKTIKKQGIIKVRVTDNNEISEVNIDGEVILLDSNGYFEYSTYIPYGDISLKIEAFDSSGLSSSIDVVLKRDANLVSNEILFDKLNPLGKAVTINQDALALIIGISEYENISASASYADRDANIFSDYATELLGIPNNRVKTLLNYGADEKGILLSLNKWLKRLTSPGVSDIYIFFAGHGLASSDGKEMYLLPFDGSPELLDKTAILRDELFKEISLSKPKTVTVFLDTCYSGSSRNTDTLISSRPIAIVAKNKPIPNNFNVFSASAGDQTAKPLEEAKHGMFSYFLMKGMEGYADTNKDKLITMAELHGYVLKNVTQQSSGSQTPEFQGNGDKLLVKFE